MSVYSTCFYAGALSIGGTTLYTVPALKVVVVRCMVFDQFASGTIAFLISSNVSGLGSAVLWQVANATVNVSELWNGRVVLPAGSTITGSCATTSNSISISGYLLDG